jgi:hypothetical protein
MVAARAGARQREATRRRPAARNAIGAARNALRIRAVGALSIDVVGENPRARGELRAVYRDMRRDGMQIKRMCWHLAP